MGIETKRFGSSYPLEVMYLLVGEGLHCFMKVVAIVPQKCTCI